MRRYWLYSLIAVALMFAACSEESNSAFQAENFTSIFDSNKFDSAYYPIDVVQTEDEGYLVLARKKTNGLFAGVYVLRANKFGTFEKHIDFDESFANPVGKFIPVGANFAFVCMDANNTGGLLVSVNDKAELQGTTTIGINYPSASALAGNRIVVLGYDNGDKQTVISTIDPATGNTLQSKRFSIGVGGEQQIEEYVIDHALQYGRKLPFFVGQLSSNLFYFNGFYNYTFSMVFTDLNSDDPNGLIQGQHDEGGFSAAVGLGGDRFALSVFNFGDNYILPNKSLAISSAPGSAVDLGGFTLPELVANANVRILRATINDKPVIIFAGDTKSRQIGLWFYDETSSKLLSSRYLGFSNPYEVGNLYQTKDGGLVVCGTTYLAGRFPRVCLFKLSRDEVNQQAP